MQFQIAAILALAGFSLAAPAALEARGDKSYSCHSSFSCSGIASGSITELGNQLDKLNGPFGAGGTSISCKDSLCAHVVGGTASTQQLEAAVLKLEQKCYSDQCGKAAIDGKDTKNGYVEFYYSDN